MSDFAKAIETVITVHEGGFQNRVDDPGNWTPSGELRGTKFGISAHSFPDVKIEDLTLTEAESLYREIWGHFAALDNQRLLTKVLDMAVNLQWADKGPATKILQESVVDCGGRLEIDGAFGPLTADAANQIDPGWLLQTIVRHAVAYYKALEMAHPEMKAWFKGWDGRAAWLPPEEA